MKGPVSSVTLRGVCDSDLDVFFAHQQDPVAVRQAAFVSVDPTSRPEFDARWSRIRSDPDVVVRTICCSGFIVGHVASFVANGQREITYWIDRVHWGRGVATLALSSFLGLVVERPLHARAAKDNVGSIRVLEKCGFRKVAEDRGFANARGEEIDEVIYVLDAPSDG
jgi:RimJ/RimL family protein N-acetyltransferase